MIGRRGFLAGLSSALAGGAALAEAPLHSPRPRPRGAGAGAADALRLWREARLSGEFAFLAQDGATGRVLGEHQADLALPPASVAKIVTALFALEQLGPDYRFRTRLMRRGAVSNGRLEGDLFLVGGGDPNLDSDRLADLAAALAGAGIKEVTGRFVLCDGALPYRDRITGQQPDHLGYNPAISGLNLNYNRVNLEWARDGAGGWRLAMDARGERVLPSVTGISAEIAERDLPVFTHRQMPGGEHWTVARTALTGPGSRWLPVRKPAPYLGEVFATLARAHGLRLPKAEVEAHPPDEAVLILSQDGDPLTEVLRGLLKHSTNLTAEVVGLTASGAGTLSGSALAMTDWARRRLGLGATHLFDHSGLGPDSRTTARDLVTALTRAQGLRNGHLLPGLLRETGLADRDGREAKESPFRIHAKSGTMNFVTNLAGQVDQGGPALLRFALLCADMPRRDAVPMDDREEPDGAKGWAKRARRLHQQMIRGWAMARA